jgi:hypothetical protein
MSVSQQQQQVELEEKMRKLQEMNKQDDEFEKHLALTLPVSSLLHCICIYNL